MSCARMLVAGHDGGVQGTAATKAPLKLDQRLNSVPSCTCTYKQQQSFPRPLAQHTCHAPAESNKNPKRTQFKILSSMAAEGALLETLPAWATLNDLDFFDVKVATTKSRGQGLVAERALSRLEDTFDIPTLLRIPNKLVLSAETVELYAKVDGNFKQLLDSAGQKVNDLINRV